MDGPSLLLQGVEMPGLTRYNTPPSLPLSHALVHSTVACLLACLLAELALLDPCFCFRFRHQLQLLDDHVCFLIMTPSSSSLLLHLLSRSLRRRRTLRVYDHLPPAPTTTASPHSAHRAVYRWAAALIVPATLAFISSR